MAPVGLILEPAFTTGKCDPGKAWTWAGVGCVFRKRLRYNLGSSRTPGVGCSMGQGPWFPPGKDVSRVASDSSLPGNILAGKPLVMKQSGKWLTL